MECERQEQEHQPQDLDQLQMEEQTRNINGDLFVKVMMSDKQMEDLRKQIAAFATICEQLEELHRSLTFQTDPTTGFMFRNPYCTPVMASSHHHHHHGNKNPRRQRWNPTSEQLQILERMIDQGNETPSKDKVKGITAELAKHGQIAETNVYNWFQNRRARLKKKQQMSSAISETNNNSNNDQSETEMAIDSSNGEKSKDSELISCENFSKKVSVEDSMQQEQQPVFPVEASLKATDDDGGESFGQIDLHGRMLSKTKWDHLHEDMAVNPESYYPYIHDQNYTSIE